MHNIIILLFSISDPGSITEGHDVTPRHLISAFIKLSTEALISKGRDLSSVDVM